MSDFKSKLPDLKELSSMATTLFNAIKTGVDEIIKDYKEKRPNTPEKPETNKTEPKKSKDTPVDEKKD
jgi:hypothetical protein